MSLVLNNNLPQMEDFSSKNWAKKNNNPAKVQHQSGSWLHRPQLLSVKVHVDVKWVGSSKHRNPLFSHHVKRAKLCISELRVFFFQRPLLENSTFFFATVFFPLRLRRISRIQAVHAKGDMGNTWSRFDNSAEELSSCRIVAVLKCSKRKTEARNADS